jgi:hypothetical protein
LGSIALRRSTRLRSRGRVAPSVGDGCIGRERGSRCVVTLGLLLAPVLVEPPGGGRHVREDHAVDEEDGRADCGHAAQEGPGAAGSEDGAARAAAKRHAHASALALLQQHNDDQEEADDHLQDGQ